MADAHTPQQKALMTRAAVLFFLAMLTGIWVGVVFTQGRALMLQLDLHPKHERLALGAHLNALFGCFWLLGVAWTLPHSRLSEQWKARLAALVSLVAYANWAVTLLASVVDARGLAFEGNPRNDAIAVLLMLGVVLPGFAASGLWAWGMLGARER